jgi:hypothetical protein
VKKVLVLEIAEKEKANWIPGKRMGLRRRSIKSWNFLQMVRLFSGFWDRMNKTITDRFFEGKGGFQE